MGQRMQWSEAEEIVRAYRTEVAGTSKRRFIDRSGALSAALTLAVAAVTILTLGPRLLAHHPILAALRPAPTPVVAPFAPTTPVFARSLIIAPATVIRLRTLDHDEDL